MRLTKTNSVILEVTADKLELCVGLYEDTRALAKAKNKELQTIRKSIYRHSRSRENTYYVRVYIGEKE